MIVTFVDATPEPLADESTDRPWIAPSDVRELPSAGSEIVDVGASVSALTARKSVGSMSPELSSA